MLPVADINLQTFLEKPDLDDRARSFIRPFFGCITAALCYLHDNHIRHKDIKPSNVLIKHDQVYLTDFGTSLDWSGHDNSTTATAPPTTPRYCAPEVMSYVERNTSSDIWSLGCVFLEMWTVLRRHTLDDLRTYMSAHGTQVKEYHSNPDGFTGWIQVLERVAGPSCDHVPSNWVLNMLQLQPALRWNCHILEDRIREASTDPTAEHIFSGLCCLEPDEDITTDTGSSSDSEIEMNDQSTPALESSSAPEPVVKVKIAEISRRAEANTTPPAIFALSPLSKKVAPSPFFRWAAGSGTARKESVDRDSAHTDGVPIPRVVISDYNAPLQPRVEDESESLAREIQEPSVSPPSTKEAEPASIDEDEAATPPREKNTASSLGEESWISGFSCMICRSGLDTVAGTFELPCHHWIHKACFSRGYPHYSGYCATCSMANQKPPKQANRGFAGPHRWGSPQQSLEPRAKDAEARANVSAASQKMKQPLDERIEGFDRNDLERRPISPNPVASNFKSKSTDSGRTLRNLFGGTRTAQPPQTKPRPKSKPEVVIRQPGNIHSVEIPSSLDDWDQQVDEHVRRTQKARKDPRASTTAMGDFPETHHYDPPGPAATMGTVPSRPRFSHSEVRTNDRGRTVGYQSDRPRSTSVEAQTGYRSESPQDRPGSTRVESEGYSNPIIHGNKTRYYYPVSGSGRNKFPHRTVLREPSTRTHREERERGQASVDKPRRRGRQPSYGPEDVQYAPKYGPEDVRWAPRSVEDDRANASNPTLGRTATYVY
jgi:serine/threonine protein kinase